MREIRAVQAVQNVCPYVKNPFRECYCFDLSSKTIDSAITYCGNNFRSCGFFKKFQSQVGPAFRKISDETSS